jgi:hypothetical protein
MPYVDSKSYPYGSCLRHKCHVEVDDNPSDPSTVAVYFVDPLGTQTGPFTPTRVSQGNYECIRSYTSTTPTKVFGQWECFWRGIGVGEGSGDRKFNIMTSQISTSI